MAHLKQTRQAVQYAAYRSVDIIFDYGSRYALIKKSKAYALGEITTHFFPLKSATHRPDTHKNKAEQEGEKGTGKPLSTHLSSQTPLKLLRIVPDPQVKCPSV